MKFTITEKKIQVSDEIKEYAERKVSKIDRFFRGDAEAFITFSSERGRYKAEVTIENNGTFYRVIDRAETPQLLPRCRWEKFAALANPISAGQMKGTASNCARQLWLVKGLCVGGG